MRKGRCIEFHFVRHTHRIVFSCSYYQENCESGTRNLERGRARQRSDMQAFVFLRMHYYTTGIVLVVGPHGKLQGMLHARFNSYDKFKFSAKDVRRWQLLQLEHLRRGDGALGGRPRRGGRPAGVGLDDLDAPGGEDDDLVALDGGHGPHLLDLGRDGHGPPRGRRRRHRLGVLPLGRLLVAA